MKDYDKYEIEGGSNISVTKTSNNLILLDMDYSDAPSVHEILILSEAIVLRDKLNSIFDKK
jgi:hypothetical protein